MFRKPPKSNPNNRADRTGTDASTSLRFEDPSATDPQQRPAPALASAPSAPAFTGQLTFGVGARLLMQLFAQSATGRLAVETATGDARSRASIFFVRGEPVHVEPAEGAVALWRQLGETSYAQGRRSVADGVAALARLGAEPAPILTALRDLVRTHARAVLDSADGSFAYFVDESALEHVPFVAVHPFGLLVERARASTPPDELLRAGERWTNMYVTQGAGFAEIAPRVAAFTGRVDLTPLVDGTRTAPEIFAAMRLDSNTGGAVMGALVLKTLVDSAVVVMSPLPRTSSSAARSMRKPELHPQPATPLAISEEAAGLAQIKHLGPSETAILSLYLELKPERDDTALLGVDVDCRRAALDRAHEGRLAQIDPRLVPAGPARPYLLARIEELRAKFDRAYRAHASRTPRESRGAYVLLDRIGEGGMAEVFRGRSTETGRIVAIKRIRPENKDDGEFVRRLLEEARLARRVRHPNVVRTLNAGKSGDDIYLAMEWVQGNDLHGLIKETRRRAQRIPLAIACRVIADAAGGLHAAHTTRDGRGELAPILHCDVSTSNILVSTRGEVKLTDFGIARALDTGARKPAADEPNGLVRGKIPYICAELFDGAPPSVRTDLYALGMTLYCAIARLPFLRATEIDTMAAILRAELPPPSALRPDVPRELDAILLRACAREPDERFESVQAMQIALEEWLALQPAVDLGAWVRDLRVDTATPVPGDDAERTVAGFAPTGDVSSGSDPSHSGP